MDNSSSQEIEQDNEKDGRQLIVKLFQVLSEGGITILAEHAELVFNRRRFRETNPDGSAKAQGNSQDKSSFYISWSYHNKKMDLHHIAGDYVNSKGRSGQTPLHLCAKTGDTELVDIFLKAGANVNTADDYKNTPLHLSAFNGHKEQVDIRIKAGANIEAGNMAIQTPLHVSVDFKHDDVTDLLLRAGADVNVRDILGRTCLDNMDDRQRLRFGFKPRKVLKLRNAMYSLTNSKKQVQSSTSTKTKTEHTETISATFTDLNSGTYPCQDIRTIHNEDSRNNNGQDETSRDMSTLLTRESSLGRSVVKISGLHSLCSPSSQTESQGLDNKDLQERKNSIRQQVENYWAKFSLETTEDCETSLQTGRIVIPTTINITQNKIIQNIKKVKHNYEPGTNLNISHADNVAPGGKIVVKKIGKVSVDDDVDDSYSEEESDNKI